MSNQPAITNINEEQKMADLYQWWKNALNGSFGPIHENEPQCGYYRKRKFKNGPFEPVAIFYEDGVLKALKSGVEVDAGEVWTWVCQSPVSYEAYAKAEKAGVWDDAPAPAGHNSNAASPFEALSMEYEDDAEQANELLTKPIETQEQADIRAVWAKRLAAIAKKATDLHKVEKQPHLDAGRAVDEKWRGLKEDPKTLSDKLKRSLDEWLRKKAAEEAERQRLAREEAERLRLEAEKLAAENNNEPQSNAEVERLNREAALAEKQAKEVNASAGRTGAKVALRKFVSAKIIDYEKALLALKNHPEMKALVEQLANRAARSGIPLDGVERIEEQRAA